MLSATVCMCNECLAGWVQLLRGALSRHHCRTVAEIFHSVDRRQASRPSRRGGELPQQTPRRIGVIAQPAQPDATRGNPGKDGAMAAMAAMARRISALRAVVGAIKKVEEMPLGGTLAGPPKDARLGRVTPRHPYWPSRPRPGGARCSGEVRGVHRCIAGVRPRLGSARLGCQRGSGSARVSALLGSARHVRR